MGPFPRRRYTKMYKAHSSSNQARDENARSQDLKANVERRNVLELLDLYQEIYSKLVPKFEAKDPSNISNARRKARIEAAMCLKRKNKFINISKQIGSIAGVEVGDEFQFRTEMYIIGLHCQLEKGIDFMEEDGVLLATSIVESSRYANVRSQSNTLTYIGHGGNPRVRGEKPTDQKLEQGNLALMNSMDNGTPVRVVFKTSKSKTTYYTYDGLYIVEKMTEERGEFGKLVFKFFLTKIPEQPSSYCPRKIINEPKSCEVEIAQKKVVSSNYIPRGGQEKFHIHERVCFNDISRGKENFPVRVVMASNLDDDDLKLMKFDYIVRNVYKNQIMATSKGCDCTGRCMENEKCTCASKNGGRLPYGFSRQLHPHQTHSLICECGPSCKCSSTSCINRVSQFGMKCQLDIFKANLKGWGVRTRSSIDAGTFVCEYVGEVCLDERAKLRQDYGNCSFKIGLDKGFIDATHCGNVARFINHSCSPNLCVKDVLYDHGDERIPHKMLFALKKIPAGRELYIDYTCLKKKFEGIKQSME